MELCVKHINKSFGEKQVLKDISFQVTSGQALGLLGRNGAGKTTTLRILTDIFRADSGEILLDGAVIRYDNVKMGYLPEERGLYPKVSVGEQMVYIGQLKGLTAKASKKNAMDLLEELEATDYWQKKLETLSKGNQQKIQLAIAVLHDPDIIILDEPFSGLDPVNAKILKDLITKQVHKNKVVMFSSHQMPYVEEFCQHICILNHGTIVLDGRIKDIKKSYLRSRIAIIPEDTPNNFLKEIQKNNTWQDIINETVMADETITVTLKNPDDKQVLFNLLSVSGLKIDSFGVVEPTLEEIFVEKVGA